jgi:hypothetical protein
MPRSDFVDVIFAKLTLVYGRDFLARWAGLDMALVKDDWAHELEHYANRPDAIAHALSLLPADKPPTVLQFRDLCRSAPGPVFKAIAAPRLSRKDAARRVEELRIAVGDKVTHPKSWAMRIVERAERGEPVPTYNLRLAQQALGMSELVDPEPNA